MMKLELAPDNDLEFILKEIQKGNERAFDFLFNQYYASLSRFSFSFVKDQDKAESLVQDVFIKLWEKRETIGPVGNLFSYLMGMVRNQSIDYLRKEKLNAKIYTHIHSEESGNTTEEQVLVNDFEEKLLKSILKLPERCRIAFELSRFDGLSNKEIALYMQISVKGVEALIGRSLKLLRIELLEFLPSGIQKNHKQGSSILLMLFEKHLKSIGIY